uniref:uncharacterized protein LOC120346224 n=1 Tax=Styela clava TaxID=7725 RepID=UPI00193A5199|nr:uncharacterized protein LOC120346224 [Styela clava]
MMLFIYSDIVLYLLIYIELFGGNKVCTSTSIETSPNHIFFYASQDYDNVDSSRTKRQLGKSESSANKECDFQSLASATQICETLFFNELKRNKKILCSKVYKQLRRCILSKSEECSSSSSSKTRINRSVQKSLAYYMEAKYCNDGSLSTSRRPINYCRLEYNDKVKDCYNEYHRTFRRNPNDTTLCSLYAESKSCALNAENEMCSFKPILKQVREISEGINRCWNPFCSVDTFGNNKVSASEKGLSFSFLLGMIRGKLRLINRRGIDTMKEYKNAKTIKSGVPKDCKYNQAVVISIALDQITEEFNPVAKDDSSRYFLVGYQNSTTTSKPQALAKIAEIANKESQDDENGCKTRITLSNLLVIISIVISCIVS